MQLSAILNKFQTNILEISGKKYWYLFLVIPLAIVVLINGLGLIPEEHYQRLSQNPYITRTDIHPNNYWQETLLLPLTANILGLTTRISFNLLCLFIIVCFYALLTYLSFLQYGPAIAIVIATIVISSPLTTILFSWLGSPDGVTVLLILPFLFLQSSWIMFLLAILGGANHLAFSIAVLEILLLRLIYKDKVNFTHLVFTFLGCLAGYGLVQFFLFSNSITVASRLDFILAKSVQEWLQINARILPLTFFSLFNVQWLLPIVSILMFFGLDKKFYLTLITLITINFLMVFFTLDTTRIFSLLSWGVLIECVFRSIRLIDKNAIVKSEYFSFMTVIGVLSLASPRFYSWVGEIHSSPFIEFISRILN